MTLAINADLKLFADKINITSSRLKEYDQSTIDEIIEAEASRGNIAAIEYAHSEYNSPEKIIQLLKLMDFESRFQIINNFDINTKLEILPMLEQEDLVMGLYFFTQEKLLQMLLDVKPEELIKVAKEAFSLEQIVMMLKEDEVASFFMHKDLEREDVMNQIKLMPPEVLQIFIESVTGKPMQNVNFENFMQDLDKLSDDKFKKFMSQIDPGVQRQLIFQLTKEKPEYMLFFDNITYVEMLSTLYKPEMIKPMFLLEKNTLVKMMTELSPELMAIVGSQIDAKDFAKFLLNSRSNLLEKVLSM